jgi:hypothetical protein
MLKRSIKITFRLNAKEQQSLVKQVNKSGLSQEGYLRSLINGYVPKEFAPSRLFFHDAGATLYRQQPEPDCGQGQHYRAY